MHNNVAAAASSAQVAVWMCRAELYTCAEKPRGRKRSRRHAPYLDECPELRVRRTPRAGLDLYFSLVSLYGFDRRELGSDNGPPMSAVTAEPLPKAALVLAG